MKQEIKKVTIIIQSGTREYTVGYNGITEIQQIPSEKDFIFYVIGKKGIIAKIINCPVEVRYEPNWWGNREDK